MVIALTGHTRGLGALIHRCLVKNGHEVIGFSLSTGCDLRDYSQVGQMIDSVRESAWFINCAHPDYCQAQILYRLVMLGYRGKILNIGSPVVHRAPAWNDLGLLEYVTQKTALHHAHTTLSNRFEAKIFMWEPLHAQDEDYVADQLGEYGL